MSDNPDSVVMQPGNEPTEESVEALVKLLKDNSLWEPLKERERELSNRQYDPLEKRPEEPVITEIMRLMHHSIQNINLHQQLLLFTKARNIAVRELFPELKI